MRTARTHRMAWGPECCLNGSHVVLLLIFLWSSILMPFASAKKFDCKASGIGDETQTTADGDEYVASCGISLNASTILETTIQTSIPNCAERCSYYTRLNPDNGCDGGIWYENTTQCQLLKNITALEVPVADVDSVYFL